MKPEEIQALRESLMGPKETALQVARRMRADYGDDEIRAELLDRVTPTPANPRPADDWPADEIDAAVLDSRWTTSAEMIAAVGERNQDAIAAAKRGVLQDLLAAEAQAHLLTPEEELEAISDPDAVLARHGYVSAAGRAGKREAAIALLRSKAAEDPRRCLRAVRAVRAALGRSGAGTARPTSRPRSPRARARREQRHVAQATSSASSGEPHQPSRHAPGLAVCPLCTNEDLTRPGCPLCRGLGFVGRELRNRWKRGYRP